MNRTTGNSLFWAVPVIVTLPLIALLVIISYLDAIGESTLFYGKIARVIAFCVIIAVWIFSYARWRLPDYTRKEVELAFVTAMLTAGLIIELLPIFLELGENFDYANCIADAAGVVIGYWVVWLKYKKKWRHYLMRRIYDKYRNNIKIGNS